MILEDFHVHTRFCDGRHTPQEIVETAIEKGLSSIGFSAHSYTFFDESYCLLAEREPMYRTEIERLKAMYRQEIEILCGIEQDFFAENDTAGYDYVIGAVHYIKKDGFYYSVDDSPAAFGLMADEAFGGDYYALCEAYYSTVAQLFDVLEPDVIAHFDLVSKFNADGRFFDEEHPRYKAAWQGAMDALLPYGIPFEVNTGAMARGYKDAPYPSLSQLAYLAAGGGSVILSSDCHDKNQLLYGFDRWEEVLRSLDIPIVSLV